MKPPSKKRQNARSFLYFNIRRPEVRTGLLDCCHFCITFEITLSMWDAVKKYIYLCFTFPYLEFSVVSELLDNKKAVLFQACIDSISRRTINASVPCFLKIIKRIHEHCVSQERAGITRVREEEAYFQDYVNSGGSLVCTILGSMPENWQPI